MPGWMRMVGLSAVAGLAGCKSDRASDGKAESSSESSKDGAPATVPSLPSWTPVPSPSPGWSSHELLRDAAAFAAWDGLADAAGKGRAAWALGRIGGPRAVDRLLSEVRDEDSSAATLGAVAFLEPPVSKPGEPPDPRGAWAKLEDALWTRYAVTQDGAEAQAILLAVSRVGGTRSVQRLAADTAVLPSKRQRRRYEAAFEAMGILCARGYSISRAGLESVATGLRDEAVQMQAAAAYTLGRCAAPSAEQIAGEERARLVELLLPALSASDPELRRLAYKALGGLGEVPAQIDPEILAASTTMPWLVEVEAVQALVGHADGRQVVSKRLAEFPATAIDDTRVHVVLAATRGLRSAVAGNSELLGRLRALSGTLATASPTATGRTSKRLALVGCELAIAIASADGTIDRVDQCAVGTEDLPSWYGRALGVEALLVAGAAVPKTDKMAALLARAEDEAPQVAARALSGLADVDDDRVSEVLRRALGKDDVAVVAAAATAIAARAVDASRRDPSAAGPLALAVQRLDSQKVIEARLGAIEALGSLARSATKPAEVDALGARLAEVVLPLASDDNASVRRAAREALLGKGELIAKFDAASPHGGSAPAPVVSAYDYGKGTRAKGLRLKTAAGEIVIEFDGAPAPIMQAVLTNLVDDGFYDGLTIHRVVPGFVVQGGDPHGDGYGGPGFVVPCERSTLRYERGTVGIALAGKDTGGSQFFVTQTRQPHLDARYTVVGRVTQGMDVVDRLLPHDAIEDASLLP